MFSFLFRIFFVCCENLKKEVNQGGNSSFISTPRNTRNITPHQLIVPYSISKYYQLQLVRECHVYNRRQNELRDFALNWVFYVLLTSKGGNIAFPPLSPPCNVVRMLELPTEHNKHRNLKWRGKGRGADCFFSEITLFEYNVPTILSPIIATKDVIGASVCIQFFCLCCWRHLQRCKSRE